MFARMHFFFTTLPSINVQLEVVVAVPKLIRHYMNQWKYIFAPSTICLHSELLIDRFSVPIHVSTIV